MLILFVPDNFPEIPEKVGFLEKRKLEKVVQLTISSKYFNLS